MPETPPGQTRPGYDTGHWESISRDDYHAAVDAAGGLEALGIYSTLTRPEEPRYFWTARQIRGADVPLVASELTGCDHSAPDAWATCPGTHTFWRFVPEEATHG